MDPGTMQFWIEKKEDTDEDDSVMECVSLRLNKREHRQLWLTNLRKINPELKHPIATESNLPSQPFCPLLTQDIARAAKVKKPGAIKKDPFKLVNKYCKTMEPTESTILQPRQILMQLLDEVCPLKSQNPGASRLESHLKTDTPAGQKKVAALRDLSHSSSSLRLINFQELGIEALKTINQTMSSSIIEIMDTLVISFETVASVE